MHAHRSWLRPLVPALVAAIVLICAASASAATCTYSASGNWTTGGSCAGTPASTDTVVINSGIDVTVDADHSIAGITMNGGTITFAGSNPTLTDSGGFSSTSNDTLTGNGTLTVAGTETHSLGQLTVENSADLILNSTGGVSGGAICLLGSGSGTTDDPSLHINGTFTIGSGADAIPLACNSGDDGPVLQVGGTGTLVDSRSGATSIGEPMQLAQGGLVHVTAGTLQVVGGSKTGTDDGHWSVDNGTTLLFNDSAGGTTFGTHTAVDGAGAFEADGALTFPLGSTFTIPDVTIGGTLTLNDNATTYTPDSITLAGGTLSGDRDVTPGSLVDNANGALNGNFTTTIANTASLTISAELGVSNGADFILNKDFTLSGAGSVICLTGSGLPAGDPSFQVNSTFTIGSTANADPLSCNSGDTSPAFRINSGGTFVDGRAGTTAIGAPMSNAGTVHLASGQVLALSRDYAQLGGTTTIDSGASFTGNSNTSKNVSGGTMTVNGTVGPAASVSGGVLNGTGSIAGDLSNTGGSVQPGASPGIMTVNGNYTQGAGGTLQVDIDGTTPGTQYDRLAVGGTANLDGTLAIVTGGGFDPALTDTFDVVTTTGNVSGTFAALTGAQLSGKAYSASYTAGPPGKVTLALSQTSPPNQTPPTVTPSAPPGNPTTPPSSPATTQPAPVAIAGLPANQGCVPGALSLGIGVRSAGLKKVDAFLDGKHVFTSKKPHFRLLIPKSKIKAGRNKLRILATYDTGKLNKNFSFTRCRGGGRSPAIKIGGAPSRTTCRVTPFTFHAVVIGALPKSLRVTLDGKPLAKPNKLNFRLSIDVPPLAAGKHEVFVVAADRFGNTSHSAIDFLHC